jgi:catechol 2,3-dioxygenase-like lactoylglutathione lyase family enzyme
MAKNTGELGRWYVEHLGFEKIYTSESEPPIVFLKKGSGMLLELFPWKSDAFAGPSGDDRQVAHLCLLSTDLESDLQDLKDKGVEIVSEVKHLFGGAKAVFFKDGEGNWLHLVERPMIPWEE